MDNTIKRMPKYISRFTFMLITQAIKTAYSIVKEEKSIFINLSLFFFIIIS